MEEEGRSPYFENLQTLGKTVKMALQLAGFFSWNLEKLWVGFPRNFHLSNPYQKHVYSDNNHTPDNMDDLQSFQTGSDPEPSRRWIDICNGFVNEKMSWTEINRSSQC